MTPDVNVLLAASRSDHPYHEPARRWLDEALDACALGRRFSVLPMVAAGFLRLATHPKVFVHPMPLHKARAFLGALWASPGVERLRLGEEWSLFEGLCEQNELVGNDIPDAWIAAAVLANHEQLATFDRGFKRFLKPGQLILLNPPPTS